MRVSHAQQLITTHTSSNPLPQCTIAKKLSPSWWKGTATAQRQDAHCSAGCSAGCSLLRVQGMEQASRDPTTQLSDTTFITYSKQQRNFLAERIKLWDIFRFNKLSGGLGKNQDFSIVCFQTLKLLSISCITFFLARHKLATSFLCLPSHNKTGTF